jgi:hypothetical protein
MKILDPYATSGAEGWSDPKLSRLLPVELNADPFGTTQRTIESLQEHALAVREAETTNSDTMATAAGAATGGGLGLGTILIILLIVWLLGGFGTGPLIR